MRQAARNHYPLRALGRSERESLPSRPLWWIILAGACLPIAASAAVAAEASGPSFYFRGDVQYTMTYNDCGDVNFYNSTTREPQGTSPDEVPGPFSDGVGACWAYFLVALNASVNLTGSAEVRVYAACDPGSMNVGGFWARLFLNDIEKRNMLAEQRARQPQPSTCDASPQTLDVKVALPERQLNRSDTLIVGLWWNTFNPSPSAAPLFHYLVNAKEFPSRVAFPALALSKSEPAPGSDPGLADRAAIPAPSLPMAVLVLIAWPGARRAMRGHKERSRTSPTGTTNDDEPRIA